jgi:hypothetical protein
MNVTRVELAAGFASCRRSTVRELLEREQLPPLELGVPRYAQRLAERLNGILAALALVLSLACSDRRSSSDDGASRAADNDGGAATCDDGGCLAGGACVARAAQNDDRCAVAGELACARTPMACTGAQGACAAGEQMATRASCAPGAPSLWCCPVNDCEYDACTPCPTCAF